MRQNIKPVANDTESNLSLIKYVPRHVTCLIELPDEILLLICRYLPPAFVLYSFYTPDRPEQRLHRVVSDYYTNIKLAGITNNEYIYLTNLFSQTSFRPLSLTFSNEHVTSLTQRYFLNMYTMQSIFTNLRRLTMIDCSANDLRFIYVYNMHLSQLEHFHITIRKINENENIDLAQTGDVSINQFLFDPILRSIHTFSIEFNDGLILSKSLIPHQNLRNVNLVLQTIDDLYILLDGLVPNIQTLIVRLCKSKILSSRRPKSAPSCLRLINFTLLEPRINLVVEDMKSILGYMPNLIRLTLSIRDTPDPIFCHGPAFESILTEFVPHLRQFDYTMTHRISENIFVEEFVRWPMKNVFYENENYKWIHLFSLPWPSSKDDQRRLPIVNSGCDTSVTSDVKRAEYMDHVMITKHEELFQLKTRFRRAREITNCLSIDIELPARISKVTLTRQTPISSINSMVQPFVRHLIVERRLNNESEISNLARQFPKVQYLKLLLPLEKSFYIACLKRLFHRGDDTEKKNCFWPELIHFSTGLVYHQLNSIWNDKKLFDWFIENTDLKYHKYPFHVQYFFSTISIWL